jgi:hypothetical protein
MNSILNADSAAIAGHQLISVAADVGDVAIQQDAPRLAERHGSSLW